MAWSSRPGPWHAGTLRASASTGTSAYLVVATRLGAESTYVVDAMGGRLHVGRLSVSEGRTVAMVAAGEAVVRIARHGERGYVERLDDAGRWEPVAALPSDLQATSLAAIDADTAAVLGPVAHPAPSGLAAPSTGVALSSRRRTRCRVRTRARRGAGVVTIPTTLQLIDLAGGTSTDPLTLRQSRLGAHLFGIEMGLGRRVLILGGQPSVPDAEVPDLASAVVVEPTSGVQVEIAAPGRLGTAVLQLPTGDVLVLGGATGQAGPAALPAATRFAARGHRWVGVTDMPSGRSYAGVAWVGRGRAIVAGGCECAFEWPDGALAGVRAYDVGADVWSELPALRQPRLSPSVLGLEGGVLVAGGVGRDGSEVPTLEYLALG